MAPRDDFASTIKAARLALNLSQAELGAKAGLTGSYICILEARRKPPPSENLVGAIARALELDEASLRRSAALERAPEPVRRRVLRLVRERGRSRRSRDSLLATTVFHMTRRPGFLAGMIADALGLPEDRRQMLGRLAERVKTVPSADEAAARSRDLVREIPGRERDELVRALPRLLGGASPLPAPRPHPAPEPEPRPDERPWQRVPVLSSPPAGRDVLAEAHLATDTFHVDRRLWREGAYFVEAADDDAYPRIEQGDLLLVHPVPDPADGALVVFRDGARVRVRTLRRQGGDVRLEAPRTDTPPLRMPASRFTPLGVVAWIWRPLEGMPTPRRREPDRDGDRPS